MDEFESRGWYVEHDKRKSITEMSDEDYLEEVKTWLDRQEEYGTNQVFFGKGRIQRLYDIATRNDEREK